MLYDLFRAYGDALSVATLQGVPRTAPPPHDDEPEARTRRPLLLSIAEWAGRARHLRAQPGFCG
jgi:hypothetical protein